MRSAQRTAPHPGSTPGQRLVRRAPIRRSRREATLQRVRSDHWDALMIGLRAADILQQRFASVYTTHVAGLSTHPRNLLGTVQALFSLVAACGVELPDVMDISANAQDPVAALSAFPPWVQNDSDVLGALDTCRWALESFHPVVYGQLHEVEPLFDGGEQNLLALLLWVLADHTRWSITPDPIQDVIDVAIGEIPPARAAFAARIACLADQRWPRDLPMDAFGQQLDQRTYRGLNLGKAVRYVFSATDLPFADLSMDELDEMGWTGMDWYAVDFATIAADQAEARDYLQHYYNLDALVSTQPEVFDKVLGLLTEAVAATIAVHPCDSPRDQPPTVRGAL